MATKLEYIVQGRVNRDERAFYDSGAFGGVTLTFGRADRFETKEDAEFAAASWASEPTDWTLRPVKEIEVAVVAATDDAAEAEPAFATGGRSGEIRCMECGATYPHNKAHLVDADRMGCVRCNH
jgi:hypothetical protein